jgi:hypothetical protein
MATPHISSTPWPANSPRFGASSKPASGYDAARLAQAQANAFEEGVPGAKVLRFPRAPHYIFLAEEAAILREIRAFIATLPPGPR